MTSPRIGIPKNLNPGGTHDLLVVKTSSTYPGDWPEGQVSFGLYDVPMKITGLQKVAQHYLKVLLTTKGSDPFYPTRGTFLPNLMLGANVNVNEDQLVQEVQSAVNDASDQVRVMLNVNSADLESTLDRVEVLAVQRVDEGWFVALYMLTLAGEGASISVPFPEHGFQGKAETPGVEAPVEVLPPEILVIESPQYPIQVIGDNLSITAGLVSGLLLPIVTDSITVSSVVQSGVLTNTLSSYNNWAAEGLSITSSLTSGSLLNGLSSYNNWSDEKITITSLVTSGSLTVGLVSYNNWSNSATERITITATLQSGTLT